MSGQLVSSFVVRFTELAVSDIESDDSSWRIKVTHVQSGEETTVISIEEASEYMKLMLERGRLA